MYKRQVVAELHDGRLRRGDRRALDDQVTGRAEDPLLHEAVIVDFTLPTTQVYDNDARKNVGGVMVLAAGDATFNETIRYTGSGNDRDPILIRVGSTTPNNSVAGYWREDVNMDGVVKYTGSANDRDIILTNVGSTTPNNTRVAALP